MRHKASLLVFAAVSAMVAAYGAAVVPEVPAQPETLSPEDVAVTQQQVIQVLNIMDNARLRYTCIIGALGGAVISIAMFSTPRFRPMAAKFTVSAVTGSMITPSLMRVWNVPQDTDWILASAFAVSICAYSVLQALVPLVPRSLAWAFRTKYMPPEEDADPKS